MAYGVRQVPQNIMSVQFKIFDIMTLKQFAITIALLFLCFIFFYTLPSGWNIVVPIFIIIIGGVIVYVPFNGEPFQEFLSSYMEAMISPQRRIWHKKGIVLKSAAEKALYYRYGQDIEQSEKLSAFNPQMAYSQESREQQQLNQAEESFLKTEVQETTEKKYTPPQAKTQNNKTQIQPSNTPMKSHYSNVSDSSLFNTTKLSQYQQNPQTQQQPQINRSQNNSNVMNAESIESAVRNFIFGSIENYEDKPVENATIYLKNPINGENIEVLYSNAAGEFKTNYEYVAGKYNIQVIVNNSEFNNILIDHRPIDPQPITIKPTDYEKRKAEKTKKIEEDEIISSEIKGDVFDGAYDPSVFSIGADYTESITSQTQNIVENKPTYLTQETQTNTNFNFTAAGGNGHNAYIAQANNIFDQMNSNRMVNDYKDINSPRPAINQVQMLDFYTMPNATMPFEQTLVTLPNTLNGILVDPNGYGIAGAYIRVFDKDNTLITSMTSDNTGRFYSFSPLPNDYYTMYISKGDQNLVGFNVQLNGSVLPPKYISFTY